MPVGEGTESETALDSWRVGDGRSMSVIESSTLSSTADREYPSSSVSERDKSLLETVGSPLTPSVCLAVCLAVCPAGVAGPRPLPRTLLAFYTFPDPLSRLTTPTQPSGASVGALLFLCRRSGAVLLSAVPRLLSRL